MTPVSRVVEKWSEPRTLKPICPSGPKRPLAIQAETVDIEAIDIGVETILLRRADGIELVDLHKVQTGQIRFAPRIDTGLLQLAADLGLVPMCAQALDPADKVLGRLARG